MNTGVQDAQDLAWRLAGIVQGTMEPNSLDSYNFERRAIAQQNTELSLINYEKTAHLASLLGVDPDLGKKILQLASSMVPKAFQKTAIQTILTAGRAPLASLSSNSNLYGRQRAASFRRRIAEGGDLSLLFPVQDVGYRYPRRQSGPPRLTIAAPEWLTVGRRVPHAWMALNDQVLVSTVHLPCIASDLSKTPSFVVLCHPSSHADWRSLLQSRQGWSVIAVEAATANAGTTFESLQNEAVRPLLQSTAMRSTTGVTAKYQVWTDLGGDERANQLSGLSQPLLCANLDGTWFEQLCVGKDGKTRFDLILRPDGHIAEILDVHASEAQRAQLLQSFEC